MKETNTKDIAAAECVLARLTQGHSVHEQSNSGAESME